jgi:hypothetical protein
MCRITQHQLYVGRFTAQNADGTSAFVRRLFLQASSLLFCLSQRYLQITQMPPSPSHVARTFQDPHPPGNYPQILIRRWSILIRPVLQLHLSFCDHLPLRLSMLNWKRFPRRKQHLVDYISHHPKSPSSSLHHIPPHISHSRRLRHSSHVQYPPSEIPNHHIRHHLLCALCHLQPRHRLLPLMVQWQLKAQFLRRPLITIFSV